MPKSSENVKEITRLKFESSPFYLPEIDIDIHCKLLYSDRSFSLIIMVSKDLIFI